MPEAGRVPVHYENTGLMTDDVGAVARMVDASTQISIARRIDAIAEWRREREFQDMVGLGPDVAARSRRSAEGLKELADYVAGVPDGDEHLRLLRKHAFSGGQFDPGPTLLLELGRFRFHDADQSIESFVAEMVEFAEQDASEHALFGGPQVPGDNPWIIRIVDDEDEDWDA